MFGIQLYQKLIVPIIVFFALFSNYTTATARNSIPTSENTVDLFNNCKYYLNNGINSHKAVACIYYVKGATDGLFSSLAMGNQTNPDCYEKYYPGISVEQIVRIVIKELDDHPEELNVAPANLIAGIYLTKFPIPIECSKDKHHAN